MTPGLVATSLALLRGERMLFRQIGFALRPGQALRIEGANGAGKTSLLRIIAGLLTPDEGQVLWRGEDIRRQRQRFASQLAWFGHLNGLKRDLTIVENLRCEQDLRPRSAIGENEVFARLGLDSLMSLPVRALSAGQQRRAALARLLLGAATLWLLDEPFTNLDRDGQQLVRAMLADHLAAGGIAVMATHHGSGMELPMEKLVL